MHPCNTSLHAQLSLHKPNSLSGLACNVPLSTLALPSCCAAKVPRFGVHIKPRCALNSHCSYLWLSSAQQRWSGGSGAAAFAWLVDGTYWWLNGASQNRAEVQRSRGQKGFCHCRMQAIKNQSDAARSQAGSGAAGWLDKHQRHAHRESSSHLLHDWVADMKAAGLKHISPSLTALVQVGCITAPLHMHEICSSGSQVYRMEPSQPWCR